MRVAAIRNGLSGGRILFALALVAGATLVTATTSGPASAASSGAPVVIGDLCSCTGPEASTISQTTVVVNAWAASVNAKGGLDGHQVQIVVKDDGYNPATSQADAQALVQQNHIVALFDNSDEDTVWATYMEQQKVPVIGATESNAGYQNPDFFPPGATINFDGGAGAIQAHDAGIKTEADLFCVEVTICEQGAAKLHALLPKVGMKLVFSAGIGYAAPNYTAQCIAAKQSGAQSMAVSDASAIVTKVAENCAAQGYTPTELSADGSVAIAWLGVPAMNGNLDVQADLPWFVHNAATKPMYAALEKYAPGVTTGPNFGEVVVQSWAAGVELQLAAQAGHLSAHPTAAQIIDGLYALKGTTLDGLVAPITFHKGQPASNPCFYQMGIKNGKFVELDGGKTICVPKKLASD